VHPDFLRVILSFGDEPHITEAGSSNFSAHSSNADDIRISYELRYVEKHNRKGDNNNPWSLRHTGIYHHHEPDFDLFIVLNPIKCSVFDRRIARLETDREECLRLCKDPFRLHNMLFHSYLDNWKWYFRYIGDNFANEVSLPMLLSVSGVVL
jgi:hypothetical protein